MSVIEQAVGTIVGIGGVVSALLTIEKLGTRLSPLYKIKKWLLGGIHDRLDDFDARVKNMENQQLKLLICNDKLPLKERVIAGDEYIERGLNGEIKIKVELLRERLRKEVQKKLEKEFSEGE